MMMMTMVMTMTMMTITMTMMMTINDQIPPTKLQNGDCDSDGDCDGDCDGGDALDDDAAFLHHNPSRFPVTHRSLSDNLLDDDKWLIR